MKIIPIHVESVKYHNEKMLNQNYCTSMDALCKVSIKSAHKTTFWLIKCIFLIHSVPCLICKCKCTPIYSWLFYNSVENIRTYANVSTTLPKHLWKDDENWLLFLYKCLLINFKVFCAMYIICDKSCNKKIIIINEEEKTYTFYLFFV